MCKLKAKVKKMKSIALVLLSFLAVSSAIAQTPISLDLITDKVSYEYGETIIVEVKLTNTADTSYTFISSSSCVAMIGFNDVEFEIACTTDEAEFHFVPGQSTSFFWFLDPSELGIPDKDGTQTIRGWSWGAGKSDSTQIQAPKYYGGILSVYIKLETLESDMDSLRNRINAEILSSYQNPQDLHQYWKITGHSIDSLKVALRDDDRFRHVFTVRSLQIDSMKVVTSIPYELEIPSGYSMEQNYPNPFNPTTTISFTLLESQHVKLDVFDIKGRKVSTLVDGVQESGTHNIVFNASNLSSGTYIYRISSGDFVYSRSMLLVK